ncbi:Fic family protein [Nisaea sp.]|uniref:Fic family protein n=1 Tax=Nisaea sp. TaxID=2024842 RepID=UPI003265E4A0
MLETPDRIEPCLIEDAIPETISDLVAEIKAEAALLGRGLHPDSALELAGFVRLMNCYYSNLIEGNHTRPKDIENAMKGALPEDESRPLAELARAHIEVQQSMDAQYAAGALRNPVSPAFLQSVHKAFYENMPEEFRFMGHPDGRRLPIVPGRLRENPEDDDVEVGDHFPPSSDRVAAFMAHFETRYSRVRGRPAAIRAIPAAHHRFAYIHPFPDGNGRVGRLMSHAMCLDAGIGGYGLWSISRGLARGLRDKSEYKARLARADAPRQGTTDGRGNLSEARLFEFTEWFLHIMLDQIRFSAQVFDLEGLEARYSRLILDLSHGERAVKLITAVLRYGSMARGDAGTVLGVPERTAREVLKKLVARGFLTSETPKRPVRIAFPVDYRERLFPNLFTDAPLTVPEYGTVAPS